MFLAVFVGTLFWFSSASASSNYQTFLMVSAPLLIAGLAEDLGYQTGVQLRLLAAILSGTAFVIAFGQWLPRFDVPILDAAMAIPLVAIPITVLACAGVTHSFNLIDGLNGLSSLFSIGVCIALMAICVKVGLWFHFQALGLLLAALAGFVLVNFPFGRVFLGDGGAYVVGHILAWTSVSIVWNVAEVSTFSIFLVFFWPICETIFTMYRRSVRGADITRPDRLHFHQLVMRFLELSFLGRKRRNVANPLAAVVVVMLATPSMIMGVWFYDSVLATALLSLCAFVVFCASYLVLFSWAQRRVFRPTV